MGPGQFFLSSCVSALDERHSLLTTDYLFLTGPTDTPKIRKKEEKERYMKRKILSSRRVCVCVCATDYCNC